MVDLRETLKAEAAELASTEERKAGKLRRKLAGLDETRAKLKPELDNTASAAARVHRYQPVIGETPQCPGCWILRAKYSPMVGQGSGGDLFKCPECGHEVPLKP
ncbi:putative nucleic acid-binding Zn-ribbon protein [Mesorhizobium sangaii]|uniref:Putative nucleic acid-binding Zn-ribbon protein n=1 Tax=Mesorhizobium sangaii TaxID=505389 RepID=A0A841PCP1_9HYPH|nr:putative nucleic acid-binding Zn-ribbon protein [Mesorhizobium sangaii]